MSVPRKSTRARSVARTSRTGAAYEQRGKARGHGEGTIYQRQDTGKWVAGITLPDGKRKYLYADTREDVARKLTRALHDLEQGIAPPNQTETVGSWLTRYLEDLQTRGAAHGTQVRYRGIFAQYLRPELGRVKLAQLQPQQVQTYQAAMLKRGLSVSSITLHRTLLGGSLKQAVAFGLIPRNVVALVKPPRAEDKEAKGAMLSPDQARALLATVRGDRLEAFYLLLLTAGLRRGEALGVRWGDLELGPTGGTVHVRQQLQWPEGRPTLVAVKSRKGLRSIPLPAVTVQALQDRRERQRAEREDLGEDAWTADGMVFNAETGAPLHRQTISQQFIQRLKAAGLPHFRMHDLRHTYGSLLMSKGVPLKTISELMGHASIEVTANVYLHSLDVQVRDTARSVEEALAAPAAASDTCPTCGQPVPQRAL